MKKVFESKGTFVDKFEVDYNEDTKMIQQITLRLGDKSEEQLHLPVHIDFWCDIQKEILEEGAKEGFKGTPMYDLIKEMIDKIGGLKNE